MQTDSLQSPPPRSHPPSPKLKSEQEVGGGGSMNRREGKKIQLNYHCFNVQISFISLMLAQTKFITLLQRGAQGGWEWGCTVLCLEGSFLPPPRLKLCLLNFFLPEQHHLPPQPPPSTTVTPSLPVAKGSTGRRKRREKESRGGEEGIEMRAPGHVLF